MQLSKGVDLMVKMFKLRCTVDVNLFKNGNFIKGEIYIARTAKNGEIYGKGNKENWVLFDPQSMSRAKPMKEYFEVVEEFYVNNHKEALSYRLTIQ
jgi:hypothetical protein